MARFNGQRSSPPASSNVPPSLQNKLQNVSGSDNQSKIKSLSNLTKEEQSLQRSAKKPTTTTTTTNHHQTNSNSTRLKQGSASASALSENNNSSSSISRGFTPATTKTHRRKVSISTASTAIPLQRSNKISVLSRPKPFIRQNTITKIPREVRRSVSAQVSLPSLNDKSTKLAPDQTDSRTHQEDQYSLFASTIETTSPHTVSGRFTGYTMSQKTPLPVRSQAALSLKKPSLRSLKTPKSSVSNLALAASDLPITKSIRSKTQPRLPTKLKTPTALISKPKTDPSPVRAAVDGDQPKNSPPVIKKPERKSRLPRANPVPVATPPADSIRRKTRAGTRVLENGRVKDSSGQAVAAASGTSSGRREGSEDRPARTVSSVTPPPASSSAVSQGSSTLSNDPDLTPKKKKVTPTSTSSPGGKATIPGIGWENPRGTPSSNNNNIQTSDERTSIKFPTRSNINIVLSSEESIQKPMTRARSRHLRGDSSTSISSSIPKSRISLEVLKNKQEIPQIRRRKSRVLEMARSFEDQKQPPDQQQSLKNQKSISDCSSSASLNVSIQGLINDGTKNESLLRATPTRLPMSFPKSFSSNTTSSSNDSPNITALAETLSNQHIHRDRMSRSRSSLSDMLRYSTMSTLGSLRWEDGAGDVLLTDPNETEAMVADISLTEVTPIKPETESAALALANARARFLSVVQNDEAFQNNNLNGRVHTKSSSSIKEEDTEQQVGIRIDRDHQSGALKVESPLVDLNLRRRRFDSNFLKTPDQSSSSLSSMTTPNTIAKLVRLESQLAQLTLELERSRSNESKLRQRLSSTANGLKSRPSSSLLSTRSRPSVESLKNNNKERKNVIEDEKEKEKEKERVNKQNEREELLEEELRRLEEELEEKEENNIELENMLDEIKFENEEILRRESKLEEELRMIKSKLKKGSSKVKKSVDELIVKDVLNNNSNNSNNNKKKKDEEEEEEGKDEDDWYKRIEKNQSKFIDESQVELETLKEQIRMLRIIKVSLKFSKKNLNKKIKH